jgi:Fe-S cluster assembly protein SufD
MEGRMTTRTVKRIAKRSKVPDVAPEFSFTAADVEALSKSLAEPGWLRERRLEAWKAHTDLPMPTLRDEAWRRSDIRKLPADRLALKPSEDVSLDKALLAPLGGGKPDSQLILRPGLPTQSIEGETLADQGIVFCDWATALRDHEKLLREHLGSIVRATEGKFSALASGLAQAGALVYVPPGVRLEHPLHTIVWTPGSGAVIASQLLVIVDQGAELTLVHEVASPTQPEGEAAYAGIVELSLGYEARLRFVELQNLGRHVWNITHERARLGRNASLDWVFGSVGSRFTKTFADLDLVGEGAHARMSGFYVTDGEQHLDHDTQQNHLAAHTTSDLLFKGALMGRSRSVWQGMIYVAPGAQRTDGYQVNRNLILSEEARADSIPGLEILADDVRCTHGATVGRLEEDALFYLMSRGMPRDTAERLLIDGFFTPIMERIPFEDVRARFTRMISEKLS